MLIDFEVENFRSYRKRKRFSLVASSSEELSQNLIQLPDLGLTLVRSAAVYGPNASGKSNLLAAMHCMGRMLSFPRGWEPPPWSLLQPFALDKSFLTEPTRFRVRFLIAGVLYEYSLTLRESLVEEEHLIAHPNGRAQEWFRRKGKAIEINATHMKGNRKSLEGITPKDEPFLAVAARLEHAQLTPPARWIAYNLRDRFNSLDFRPQIYSYGTGPSDYTASKCTKDEAFHSWATQFLRHADLGIQDIQVDVKTYPRGTASGRMEGSTIGTNPLTNEEHLETYFVHSGEQAGGTRVHLHDESHGTQRLFSMLFPLYQALRDGELVVTDELGGSLHASLVRELIRAFHDMQLNPKGAQLVFVTHDTSLLSGNLFRRDQVWFAEKDRSGATDLYSLHDLKGVRGRRTLRNRLYARPLSRDPVLRPVRLPTGLGKAIRSGHVESSCRRS